MDTVASHSPNGVSGGTILPLASDAEAEAYNENINIPHTPTSSATGGSLTASYTSMASPPPSHPHHRKSASLSSPWAASKFAARTLSLRDSQLTEEQLRDLRGEGLSENIMITPPENLPPSPPLTSRETDGDAELDTEEAGAGVSHVEVEEDVTDTWRNRGRQSFEAAGDRHPLGRGSEGAPGHARADVDLEKGPDVLREAQGAVTKPFEVIRKPKRPTSPKPPHSSYYVGPPTGSATYHTPPRGQIGVHHPREIIRVERDYDNGELVQFSSSYPLELQGRITPTQFLETINALNEGLIRAHSLMGACLDNTLAVLSLWLSPLLVESRYDREMRRLERLIDTLNVELYNPQGLNILWPRKCAFLFLEIEYY